jgi:hypothetical protein
LADTSRSAEEILVRALQARDEMQFERVIDLCAPESIAVFLRGYRETIRPMSLEDVRAEHPEISEEDAPLALARFRAALGDSEKQLPSAVGVSTYDELCALSPREFGRRWLEGSDSRVQLLRLAPHAAHMVSSVRREYQIVERVELSADRVRVRYGYMEDEEMPLDGRLTGSEELVSMAGVGWRLVFHARLLAPAGVVVEYLTPEMAKLLGFDLES